MANFPNDSPPFIPPTLEIEDGANERIPRAFVNLSDNPVHTHEEYVIGVDIEGILQQDHHIFMHQG
jgi:hypothetical protein